MNRIFELLQKPYAGSKAFKYNHPDAKYVSNCHGTIAYVFGLEKKPIVISSSEMKKIIDDYFTLSTPADGCLVAFFKDNDLVHTGLLKGKQLFHQSGSGGIYEYKDIEKKKNSYGLSVDLKYYKLRH